MYFYRNMGATLFNIVGGMRSNQLVETQSKIICNILGIKQAYMSLVYTHINATLFYVAHYLVKGKGSVFFFKWRMGGY